MTAPVDHDLLADFVGGALEGTPEADRVAELIATSTAWRTAADSLTRALGAVSQDLQTLSGYEESMPADVVSRFDDLFASPSFAATPVAAKDPLASRPLEHRVPAARRKSWRKWAVPVAAAIAAVGGFLIIRGLPMTASSTTGSADSSLSRENIAAAGAPGPVPTISSGTNYTRQSLLQPSPVAQAVQPEDRGKSEEVVPGSSLYSKPSPSTLQACLDAVAAALPGTPTLVDYAKFEGRPALVISITSGSQRWMFVAGPDCGPAGAAEIYRAPLK